MEASLLQDALGSFDARTALLATYPGRHVSDLFRCKPGLRGHIAEMPVVRADSVLHGQVEGDIGMVLGPVDFVNQRRPLRGTLCVKTVASDTACGK